MTSGHETWVFAYGSLLWTDWSDRFGCVGWEPATLENYRRDFNKASVKRWGSPDQPGPTLGLVPSSTGSCRGVAFEFAAGRRDPLLAYLAGREGSGFFLEDLAVVLANERRVRAIVPVNDPSARTFLGEQSLEARVELARVARGEEGSCRDYVRQIREKLQALGVRDTAVEEFWSGVSAGEAEARTNLV